MGYSLVLVLTWIFNRESVVHFILSRTTVPRPVCSLTSHHRPPRPGGRQADDAGGQVAVLGGGRQRGAVAAVGAPPPVHAVPRLRVVGPARGGRLRQRGSGRRRRIRRYGAWRWGGEGGRGSLERVLKSCLRLENGDSLYLMGLGMTKGCSVSVLSHIRCKFRDGL